MQQWKLLYDIITEILNFRFTPDAFIFAAQINTGPVAQLNRASDYGSEGFRFES